MAPRLVSLLSRIESSLVTLGCQAVNVPGTRSVNFSKGIARLVFGDGSGSVVLQSFLLADGQVCVKAALVWAGNDTVGQESIYPTGPGFLWDAAADRIAENWMSGPPTPVSLPSLSGSPSLAAAG